ncbi:MAG TPA: glycosyltransferase, partial [Phycisphaeraceae bacterium]|nr:glycosyltransferase [Phycisphaeraceae bacterium]
SLNQARFIRRAIESVLLHHHVELELIVIDGGSTDGTLEILNSIDDPRMSFISGKDRGQADAINLGFSRARGDIVAWLNSDDEYVPGALEHVEKIFREDPDCCALYGQVDMIDEQGKVIRRYPTKPWNPSHMARKCYVSQPSVFIRRDVYETCGPLHTNLMLCLDYEYWHRVAQICHWRTTDRLLALTRIYPSTKTASRRARGIVEGCCVSRFYSGRLPLRWSVKYMFRRARLHPRRYLATPWGFLSWLSIPLFLPARIKPTDQPHGWSQRFLRQLESAPESIRRDVPRLRPRENARLRVNGTLAAVTADADSEHADMPSSADTENTPEIVVRASQPSRSS